jgi:translation elongation factor P/translation initiation factor 5A
VRTKLKAVLSGKVVDKTFNAGTKVDTANVDKRTMQYLYKDGNDYVFMDSRHVRAAARVRCGGRRRRQLHAGEPGRDVATHDGPRCMSSCPPP